METLSALWIESADTIYAGRCVATLESVTPKEKAANEFAITINAQLPDLKLGPPGKLPTEYAKRIGTEIVSQIKPVVDFRFGANRFKVECLDVRSGSLEFAIVVSVAGTAYIFVKDYDKLRANAPLLVADVRRISGRIKRAVQKLIGGPENPFKN